MTVKELTEILEETKGLLVEDYVSVTDKEPTNKDLINHVKKICKDGKEDTIIESLFLGDVDYKSDFYKLLLVFAAMNK